MMTDSVELGNVDPFQAAEILVAALPYIRRFRDKRIVIKYGGSAMTEPRLKRDFAVDIALLSFIGMKPVIVHGGDRKSGNCSRRSAKRHVL